MAASGAAAQPFTTHHNALCASCIVNRFSNVFMNARKSSMAFETNRSKSRDKLWQRVHPQATKDDEEIEDGQDLQEFVEYRSKIESR